MTAIGRSAASRPAGNQAARARPQPELRRSLTLLEATLGGVGVILGAGIYALVGEAAARGGNAVWISFLLAALMAGLTGLSYAEMASAYPKAGADYEYTRRGLGVRPAFVVGWVIIAGNLIAAAAVSLGFGGYFNRFVDVGVVVPAVGALAVATLISAYGIRQAMWTSIALCLVELAGLVLVIAIGVPHLGEEDLLLVHGGAAGIFSAAALVMFAFIGFEQIATLSEETNDAPRVVPRAMLLSIAITSLLYVLVGAASISIMGWEALSSSEAPLADVVSSVLGGRASDAVAVVALFSTGNTLLLLLVASSRLMYGMADREALPSPLAYVHPRYQTPLVATAVALLISAGFALFGDIGPVAEAANFAIFIGFAAVNLSLIVLRFTTPELERPFRIPVSIGRLPLVPVAALVSIAVMIGHLDSGAILIGLLIAGVGVFAVLVSNGKRL
jgi:APA family basic amino acid/polyamine antiporter